MRTSTQPLLAVLGVCLPLLSFLVLPTVVQANCTPCMDMGEFEASVWPDPGTTPVDTVFVLQQLNSSATGPIADLHSRNPRLESDTGDTIALQIVERFEGECATAAVTLMPQSPLLVGQTYRLSYDAADGTPVVPLLVGRSDLHTGWLVTDQTDEPPEPLLAHQVGTESVAFGCGPSNHIMIGTAIEPSDPIQSSVRVSRTNTSGETSDFLLFPNADGVLLFGHSMCQGAFLLHAAEEFDVTLTPVDAIGQMGPSETVRLTWP